MGALTIAGAVGATGFSQYWTHDVAPERERLARTQPMIHEIYQADDEANADVAVIDLVGLGNLDASETATSLEAYAGLGRVLAVEYDNSGIDTKVIADMIEHKASVDGINEIILSGHSMGGVVAIEVASHLPKEKVAAVILDCTPLTLDAVRPEERDRGEDMLRWMGDIPLIGGLPGARESRTMRAIVEMVARDDQYIKRGESWHPTIDPAGLYHALVEVGTEKIFNDNVASNGLIESQFKVIVSSSAIDNLEKLTVHEDDQNAPAIIYMRPRNAINDQVVDVDLAQRIMIDEVGGVDGSLLVARMDWTGHANPNQSPDAYNATIERQIIPFIESHNDASREYGLARGE